MAQSEWTIRYRQKRGKGTPNPIKLGKLKIRFVYPPYLTNSISERPAKDLEYSLDIGGKKPLKGKTNGQGILEQELPMNTKSGRLTLYSNINGKKKEFWTIQLEIGELGSVHSSVKGEVARQNNLGLFAGKTLNANSGPQFMRARDRFIGLFGVEGSVIESRIEEVYGS